MQETPDLSKIVSLIMQNPTLISEISSLVKSVPTEEEKKTEPTAIEQTEDKSSIEVAEEAVTEPIAKQTVRRTRRKELLNAMKPYLSDNRRTAIDSMSSILDILDVMMKRES